MGGDGTWSFSYDDVHGEVGINTSTVSQGGDRFSGSYSSPRDKGTYEGSFTSNDKCTSYVGNWFEGDYPGFFALQIGNCGSAQVARTNTEAFRTSSTTQFPCTVTSGPTGSTAGSAKDHAFHTTCYYQQGDGTWSFSYDDVHGEVEVSQGGDCFSGSYSSPRD